MYARAHVPCLSHSCCRQIGCFLDGEEASNNEISMLRCYRNQSSHLPKPFIVTTGERWPLRSQRRQQVRESIQV